MKKQKVKFVIYTHYIPTNPDGSCAFDRFDVTYHVDEVAYVYLTNAVKYAKRRYGGKDRDFCVAVRDDQYNSIVLYKTPKYRLLPGQKDQSISLTGIGVCDGALVAINSIESKMALAHMGGKDTYEVV